MITGSRVTRCEIKALDTTEATVRAHWHHIIDGTREIGSPWSREGLLTVTRSNAILTALCNEVRAFVLVDERIEWAQFVSVADIQLRMVDFVRYAPEGWGMAAFYHRLKGGGAVINGFDGSILYTVRGGEFRVHGLDTATEERKSQFEPLLERLFTYVESIVNTKVLGL